MSKTIKFLFTMSSVFIFVFAAGMADAAGSGCVVPGWINVAGNGMDAQVRLTNNVSCGPMTVSVCSYRVYQFPTGTVGWLKNQTLFDSKTVTLQPGQTVYTTVKTDNCMTQIDLFEGPCVYPFPSDNPHDLSTIVAGEITKYHVLCTNKCTDECTLNQRTCDGNGYKICKMGGNGCTYWEHTDCPSGQICSGGYCVSSCTDECSVDGQRVCSGNGWKQCGNYDSDSCLEWSSVTQCGWNQTCNNGSCVDTCQNECALGQHQCSGSSSKTCIQSGQCTAWGSWQNCDAQCYRCGDGVCNSDCGETNSNCSQDCGGNIPVVGIIVEGLVECNKKATLIWASTNATACSASGDWSGSKTTSGTESVGGFIGTKTFIITCTGDGGTASDYVKVNGSGDDLEVDAGSDKTVAVGDTIRLDGAVDGDYDSLSWYCTGGSLSDNNVLRPTFRALYYDYDYSRTYTCTLTARNECGSDSDTMKVRVERDNDDRDFNVSLIARPKSDCAPLYDVDLTATVSNYDNDNDNDYDYGREFTYRFDCENDGSWDKTITTSNTSYTAANLCDYRNVGDYTARVRVEQGNRTATDTEIVRAEQCGQTQTGNVNITKTVSNLSLGGGYQGTVSANPLNIVAYRITVAGVSGTTDNIMVADAVPAGITNIRDLQIDGSAAGGNLASGINLGTLSSGQTKTITYTATVANEANFAYGQTTLTNVATVTVDGKSANSSAAVVVNRRAVMGATTISTGFDGNMIIGLGIGLLAALVCMAWVVKTQIIDPKRDPRQILRDKIAAIRRAM